MSEPRPETAVEKIADCERLLQFVVGEVLSWPVAARLQFAESIALALKPEFDEIKRRLDAAKGGR